MSFYENTLITRQDLPKADLDKIKEKYSELINNNSGKVIKVEEWGLLNLARKIKKVIPKTKVIINKKGNDPDKRDYFVSNKKIEKAGFKAKVSLDEGIRELNGIFQNCDIYSNKGSGIKIAHQGDPSLKNCKIRE